MLFQVTPVVGKSDTVHGLSYTELAAALHASGIPSRHFRSATPEKLTDWAARGVVLAGIDKGLAPARRTRGLDRPAGRPGGSTPAVGAEGARLCAAADGDQ